MPSRRTLKTIVIWTGQSLRKVLRARPHRERREREGEGGGEGGDHHAVAGREGEIASQPLLSDVDREKIKTNLGKTAYYLQSRSTL